MNSDVLMRMRDAREAEDYPLQPDSGGDVVQTPAHYLDGLPAEAIDIIKGAVAGKEGFEAYCLGNALKYLLRAGKKGPASQDYRKAANYCRWAAGEEWRGEAGR